ncbi:MAG TPA: MTH938/NDUFAF3 family protein [Sphingomonas sp.]|nr:MTH938/NDUFAF3 family protein [Sphingomonas sp.]
MAKFSPDPVASGPSIRGFSGSGFKIDEQVFAEGVLLSADAATEWRAPPLEELDVAALSLLLTRDPAPEFLLLGTGAALRRPPPAFAAALDAQGIGLEVMDSRAAAHAWGVLRAEGREIVAALMRLDR